MRVESLPTASAAVLSLLICIGEPSHALSPDEENSLRDLCRAGLNANGGIWSSDRINSAIATLAYGPMAIWPDNAQSTAYKTCNRRGYLNNPSVIHQSPINQPSVNPTP